MKANSLSAAHLKTINLYTKKQILANLPIKNHRLHHWGNRVKELVSKVEYARSTILVLIEEGRFPEPFKLVPNGRANGWLEETIDK